MLICPFALVHALSFQPCQLRLIANTPDPTHSALPSTLTLPGQAYVLFLAFSVRPRRAGPSPLRSASARRRGRGTCPRPPARAPSSPRAPRPAGPGRVSPTSWRVGSRMLRTQPRSSRRRRGPAGQWSRLDASRDPSAGGARPGPLWQLGPSRRRWRGSLDSAAGEDRSGGRVPPLPLQPSFSRRRFGPAGHGSTRHVTPPPAVRARALLGPLRRRRRGSRDPTARGVRSEGQSIRFRSTLALRADASVPMGTARRVT
jgi:hypothetical protein